ncbi:hypothetical protein [Salinarimonas sp.]|uniref:hypothetical protein n=1 Tax=Salinarimonas sp. TaxID=2766526 RepID=UPI0032D8ED2E
MLRIAALLTATYLAAFLATSALTAPDGLSVALARIASALERVDPTALIPAQGAQAQDAQAEGAKARAGSVPALAKADPLVDRSALPRLRGAIDPSREAVEVTALPGGRLALRDADGRLLVLHDPAERTTRVARGARLPRLLAEPLGDEPRLEIAPLRPPPVETEAPEEADEPLASGCESAVSTLARARHGAGAVLCLAAL